jgi:hypothetical protein
MEASGYSGDWRKMMILGHYSGLLIVHSPFSRDDPVFSRKVEAQLGAGADC